MNIKENEVMKHTKEIRGRPGLQEKLDQTVSDTYEQDKKQDSQQQEPYQANNPLGPYAKTGLYLIGALVLIWASQFVLAALAGTIREYKNLTRELKRF